jgi:intracellular sulfur oxidation DsrE/DsrF family protein
MKRMIVAAVLLVSTVSVFAADVKSEVNTKEKLREVRCSGVEVAECSMTLTATFGPSFAQVQVSCKGTAATCKEAGIIAKSCLDEAKNIFQ